jgi:uracil-xanthine permease
VPFWALRGDARRLADGATVAPRERLGWPLTATHGLQHVLAMASATLLVPALTGLPPAASLLFSGLGTALFLVLTRNRLPAYLGSSVAFIAPLQAARGAGLAAQLGGVLVVGLVLVAVGVAVKALGNRVVDALMPPVVTGGVVLLIALNLAPSAAGAYGSQPGVATFTLLAVLLTATVLPGTGGRLAVLAGMSAGWALAAVTGGLDPDRVAAVAAAGWVGLPDLAAPQVTPSVVLGMLPLVIVLVAEVIGGVRAAGAVAGTGTDGVTGDALVANGLATTLAGFGGGVGTTIYPQNLGVSAASRVSSTAAYAVAAGAAVALSFSPKLDAALLTIPVGVLGGSALVLYGLVAMHGVKVWMDSGVDLRDPVTLMVTAAALVAGIGDLSVRMGNVHVGGVVWGTAAIMVLYPLLRGVRRLADSRDAEPVRDPKPVRGSKRVPVPEPRMRSKPAGEVGWQLGQK